jgi:hypothetical protein
MKARDIKPGEVYAYRRGRGEYASVRPVVFLAPLDSDHLYQKRMQPGATYQKAASGAKPQRGTVYNSGTIGYPAATTSHENVDVLSTATLERFGKTTSGLGRRIEYELVTSLTHVVGLYEQVAAEQEKRQQEARESRRAEQAAQQAHRERIEAQKSALDSIGVTSVPVVVGSGNSVHTISADDMDKLLALLSG